MIWEILKMVIWCVVLHEIGHFLYMRIRLKKNVEIRFHMSWKSTGFKIGYPSDYKDLSLKQRYFLYMAGIVFGLVPLMVAVMGNVMHFISLTLYLLTCRRDIENIVRLFYGRRKARS